MFMDEEQILLGVFTWGTGNEALAFPLMSLWLVMITLAVPKLSMRVWP